MNDWRTYVALPRELLATYCSEAEMTDRIENLKTKEIDDQVRRCYLKIWTSCVEIWGHAGHSVDDALQILKDIQAMPMGTTKPEYERLFELYRDLVPRKLLVDRAYELDVRWPEEIIKDGLTRPMDLDDLDAKYLIAHEKRVHAFKLQYEVRKSKLKLDDDAYRAALKTQRLIADADIDEKVEALAICFTEPLRQRAEHCATAYLALKHYNLELMKDYERERIDLMIEARNRNRRKKL